jgi:hypothetical protein
MRMLAVLTSFFVCSKFAHTSFCLSLTLHTHTHVTPPPQLTPLTLADADARRAASNAKTAPDVKPSLTPADVSGKAAYDHAVAFMTARRKLEQAMSVKPVPGTSTFFFFFF